MDDNELKRNLERLGEGRGEPRGAANVLHAARARSGVSTVRRFAPAIAVAAAVTMIGGVAAAVVATRGNDNHRQQIAVHPLDTTPSTNSTTAPTVPGVAISAKLIAASRLVPFSNCNAYTSYMRTKGLEVVSAYGLPGMASGGVAYAADGRALATSSGAAEGKAMAPQAATADNAAAPSATGAGPTDFSTTNVQEAGIDEPDVVKTDGKRIYAISNGRLYIVDAASPRILGSLEIGNGQELFVVGDRAVVFSTGSYGGPVPASGTAGDGPARYQPQARVLVVDVGKPDAMKEVAHLDVDGSYVSARLVDGVARIVFNSSPSRLAFTYPTDGSPEAQSAALDKNKAVVRDAKFDDWVGHFTVTDSAGRPGASRPLVNCGSAYHPPAFSGFGQLSVMSLDPKSPNAAKTASVAADGQTVYSSGRRLYVATTQWGEAKPVQGGAMEIMQPQSPKTLVHDFDISDSGQARYVVSGSVRGTTLNQFSFSEYDGNLRVATTDGDQSYVTVLVEQAGKVLGQIGQVGGLGKGERIYAVRFIGPLGYVVTYRQIDPLYVVDLHTPSAPKVVGELELLGYSAYLHPIGDNLLFGVGQDASPDGRRAGTQVSLFDVSNPAKPKLLQRKPFGQGGSQAEYDHHAFLYWAPRKLAVIPLEEYSVDKASGQAYQGFMGAVGMTVTPQAITEVGRVSHQNDMITRSMVIGNRLFTFSYNGLKASSLDSFQEQAFVSFNNASSSSGSAPPAKPAE